MQCMKTSYVVRQFISINIFKAKFDSLGSLPNETMYVTQKKGKAQHHRMEIDPTTNCHFKCTMVTQRFNCITSEVSRLAQLCYLNICLGATLGQDQFNIEPKQQIMFK